MQLGHTIKNDGQFFNLVGSHAGSTVEHPLFKIDFLTLCFLYFKVFYFQSFSYLGGIEIFCYFFLNGFTHLKSICISENKDDSANGVHGHDSGQEKA